MKFEDENVTICLKCGSVTRAIEPLKRTPYKDAIIEKSTDDKMG